MKISELKGARTLQLIECSCGATFEKPNVHSPRERGRFFEEHKDHEVKRFRVTTKVSVP